MSCIMGCTVEGEHLDGCASPWTSRRWLPEGEPRCGGCVLQPAEAGLLCWWHVARLRGWLADAAEQHAALLKDLEPGAGAGAEPVAGSRAPGVPLALTPLDTAGALQSLLGEMVGDVLHRYPEDAPPARLLTMGDRQSPDPVRAKWSPVLGVVIGVEPDPVYAVSSSAGWLRSRVARVASSPGVEDYVSQLGEVMGTAHRLAPLSAQRPSRVACIPCPSCHLLGLVRYPAEDIVQCSACGEAMPADGYRSWVREVQSCA